MDALKKKAIARYLEVLSRLQKGYKEDFLDILNLICFISLPTKLDNLDFIKQQLLNQNDTIYLHLGK